MSTPDQQQTDAPGEPQGPGMAQELLTEILEPHESLRYVARLFRVLAVLLLLLLVAEVALGLLRQGTAALPVLMVEATRLIVFAGVLWGIGDLALMFIESNHDLRATRVMVWQLNAMMTMRMEKEGIEVDPIRPGLDPGDETEVHEDDVHRGGDQDGEGRDREAP